MKHTDNYKLNMVESDDNIQISIINENYEKIDSIIKNMESVMSVIKENITDEKNNVINIEDLSNKIQSIKEQVSENSLNYTDIVTQIQEINDILQLLMSNQEDNGEFVTSIKSIMTEIETLKSDYGELNNKVRSMVQELNGDSEVEGSTIRNVVDSIYNILSNNINGNGALKAKLDVIDTTTSFTKATSTNNYNILNNSTYGNSAIKTTLNTVNTNTTNAYNILNNNTYGNSALNTKLNNTYNIVNNSTYGNSAIMNTLNTVSTNTTNINNGIRWIDNSKFDKFRFISASIPIDIDNNDIIVNESNAESLLKTIISVNGKGKFFWFSSSTSYSKTTGRLVFILRFTVDNVVMHFGATEQSTHVTSSSYTHYHKVSTSTLPLSNYLNSDFSHLINTVGVTATLEKSITEPIIFNSNFKIEAFITRGVEGSGSLSASYQLD